MSFVNRIKSNPKTKKLVMWLMSSPKRPKPRWYIRWFVNPFFHSKGKGSFIRGRTRMDVFPYNKFTLGKDSTIEDFSTVNNGVGEVFIGDRTRIGLGNTLIGPVKIGNDVRLAQNVVMSGLNHDYEDVSLPISQQGVNTAPIVIEDETWIGSNAMVVAGVTVGKHCVIAGGSVVTKNVPAYSVVAGNPARVLKQYNKESKTWERV